MLKHLLASLTLLFFSIQLSSQASWGKADPAQFANRTCPFDSSASAIAIVDSASVVIDYDGYGFATIYKVYKRIQILNRDGFHYGSVTIPYSAIHNMEAITDLEAQTLNINEKEKVKVSKVKDPDFFDETMITGLVNIKRFALPDIKEGSIIEYRYTYTIRNSASLHDWTFQSEIPTARSALKIKIPEILKYSIRYQGNQPLIKDNIENYTDVNTLMAGVKVHYAMNNLPGYKKEAFVGNVNNYLCKIKFHMESYGSKRTISVQGTPVTLKAQLHQVLPATWAEVARDIMSKPNIRGSTNNVAWTFYAKELCRGITDSTEKVKAIYSQFHSIMNWNKLYGTTPAGTDSTGNSARINLILINMLRAVGIKADVVLISTIDHGKVDTLFPTLMAFNSIIAVADVGDRSLFLDAGDPNRPWNLLATNDLNYLGLRVLVTQTDTTEVYNTRWMDIRPAKGSSTAISSTLVIDSDGNMKAKEVFTASDYEALRFRDRPNKETLDEYIKNYFIVTDGFEITAQKTDNELDPDKKLKIVLDVEKKSSPTDDRFLYVTPFTIKFYADNPLKESERTYPIEFGFPIQRNITVTVPIPKNYKVSELPKPKKLVLKDGSASFILLVAQNDDNVQMSGTFTLGNDVYQPEMYDDIKALYAKMIDALNSSIVLEKK